MSASATTTMSLIRFLLVIARHRKFVIVITAACTVLALVIAFVLPKWYSATAKVMPPQQSQSLAFSLLGQLSTLTGGASQALGFRNPSDIYVSILRSRTIADHIIERFNLGAVYDEERLSDTREELSDHIKISANRDGVISVVVEDQDAKRAAAMANAYVEELRALTLELAVTEAGHRRLFFEGQVQKVKRDLAAAEVELKAFLEKSRLLSPQTQVGVAVAASAALRAQITSKEIQLTAMRQFATEENPDLKRTEQELFGLRAELAKLEKNDSVDTGDAIVTLKKGPTVGLEYLRRLREVKYQEALFEALSKQYELARVDEAKDAVIIQLLERAIEPDKKSRPYRAVMVISAFIVSLMLSMLFAFFLDAAKRASEDSEAKHALYELRSIVAPRLGRPPGDARI